MKRHLVGSVLVVISGGAYSADFRDVALGDPCTVAAEAERAQNSVPEQVVDDMLKAGSLAYGVTYEGLPGVVAYNCTDGRVSFQAFGVEAPSESVAEQVYARLRADLLQLYGQPCTDWRNLPFWTRFNIWVRMSFSPQLFNSIDWVVSTNTEASLIISSSGPDAETWQVSVIVDGEDPPFTLTLSDGSQYVIERPISERQCLSAQGQ